MTGETEKDPSGWTTDTVKVLEDEKIAALERLFASEIRRIEALIAGQERAVSLLGGANQIAQDKFEATVKDGFVKQNEFRGSLDDLGKLMATRREAEVTTLALTARLDDLVKQIGDLRSRIDIGPAALAALQTRSDVDEGRHTQSQVTTTNLLAFAVAIATVAGVAGHLIH